MKVFVELENSGNGIVAISTKFIPGSIDIEAELVESLDPNLLDGYALKFNPDTGNNEVIFDVYRYRQIKAEQEEEARKTAANEALGEALHATALAMATDEQAAAMMDLYPEWEKDKKYETNDRVVYAGALYKALQEHTSQEGWEPTHVPALFVRLSDPEDEWPDFVQPTGAHDVYMTGDKVTYDDVHYICKADNVAHSPEDLPDAWEKQEEK